MISKDQKPDDLQHLVAEEFRDKVTVLPKNSMQFAFIGFGLLACGFGFVMATLFSNNVTTGIGVALILGGFIAGRFTNRQEDKLLKEIDQEEK